MTIDVGAAYRITAKVEGQQQLDRFNQSLRDSGKVGEASAGQIKAAMRSLPAQFTDIGTSLAGGQSPFLVLLQQGGQIRDQFGSVGAALRGIASLITPTAVAFGSLAVAIGGVAAAFLQGQKESENFSRALAITGNFAGITATRFDDAAERIQTAGRVTGGTARELLQAIVQTGQFGPASYEAVATAAAQVARITGQSADDVVKQFTSMGKSAADWAAESNRTYNFLDLAQYKYIRSLEEAGDKEGAQRAAAELLSKALEQREVQLGSLQRAWKRVTDTASSAWQAMLGIGREESVGERLADAQARLQRTIDAQSTARSDNQSRYQPRIDALKQEVANLQEIIKLEGRSADATAARAAENQRAIAEERQAEEERKRKTGEKQSEFDRLLKSLEDQRMRLQELGVEETLLAEIQAGRYKTLTGSERDRLLAIAREIDSTKALQKADQEAEEQKKRAQEQSTRLAGQEQRRLEAARQGYIDLIDPANRYIQKLDEIGELERRGLLSAEEAAQARARVNEQIEDLNKVKKTGKDAFDELKFAVEGWGRSATNAFVDFAFGAKVSFGDLVNSILKDIARMMIQANITKPLFQAIQTGGSFSLGSFFGFANGGIMTSRGPLPLRTYADGGIVNRPQVRVAGEGSMNEAIIPLPDGRTVPVTLRGGGAGNVNIGITINAQTGQTQTDGEGASGLRELGQRIATVARQVIVDEQRPGGLLYGA